MKKHWPIGSLVKYKTIIDYYKLGSQTKIDNYTYIYGIVLGIDNRSRSSGDAYYKVFWINRKNDTRGIKISSIYTDAKNLKLVSEALGS